MATITLICDETPNLKLGPGLGHDPIPGQLIVFKDGFAEIDPDEYPKWAEWVFATGTPHIEIVDGDSGRVPAGAAAFVCPTCGAGFSEKKKLNGHRLSHRTR